MDLIDIRNLTKDYGNHKGIFDVSFSIKKGEIVGFIGSNGAGKTTTIRHLMGFIHPQQGTARIMNMDCFKQADKIQKQIGYLPGEIAFMDQMNGYEFIRFMAKMKNINDMHYAEELISYLELDPSVKIKKMSKGMKQKIGLIIAFMQDAPILILDEPTSGLDPLMQNKFVDLIRKEKETGKTILMSSHIFEEIVLIQMLSQVNEDIEFLKYVTPLTLFQPENIIQYESMAFICIGILAVLSIVCFSLAHIGFVKRDLPL